MMTVCGPPLKSKFAKALAVAYRHGYNRACNSSPAKKY
jgi:hypothetical protein